MKRRKEIMKNKSLLKNTFYALILQFTTVLFPLITAPYISRVLGVENLGKVNFSGVVVYWFTLIASFGTVIYGVREVAKIRDNKDDLSRLFSEMLAIKAILTVTTLVVYVPLIFTVERFSQEWVLFLVQGSALLLNIVSIDWFFQGIEEYKYISIRGVISRVISLVAMFLMIKERGDYIEYAGIAIFALSFANILNYFYALKFVNISFKNLQLKKHIKPLLIFFGSIMITTVYNTLDQVFLGFVKGDAEVALFARSKQFYALGLAVLLTLNNVFFPRIANYFIKDREQYNNLLKLSINIIILIALPITVGLALLSYEIIYLTGGEEYIFAQFSLIIFSPLVLVTALGVWNNSQRMIPNGYEKTMMNIQIVQAVISLSLNLIIIKLYGFIGAAITILVIETVGLIIGMAFMSGKDRFQVLKLNQVKYLLAASIMAVVLELIKPVFFVSWLSLLMKIAVSATLYFVILLILKDETMINLINVILEKIRQKREFKESKKNNA